MKKIYDKHFRVEEHERIREHVMMMRIVLAVAVVCISLCSMGITAYAFFTYTVTSSSNIIKAASHWTSKTVTNYDSSGASVASVSEDDYIVLQNDSEDTYTYELTMKAAGTASVGYAKLELTTYDGENVYDSAEFFTDSIRKDGFVIRIVVPAGNTATLQVTDNWGTCAMRALLTSGTVLEPIFPEKKDEGTGETPEDVLENDTENTSESELQEETVEETFEEEESGAESGNDTNNGDDSEGTNNEIDNDGVNSEVDQQDEQKDEPAGDELEEKQEAEESEDTDIVTEEVNE